MGGVKLCKGCSFCVVVGCSIKCNGTVCMDPGLVRILTSICNFLVRCSVYIVCPAVLSCRNLKLHQTLEVKNIFKQEKLCCS